MVPRVATPNLSGLRLAVLRSLLVATLACAIAGIALSTRPAVEATGAALAPLRSAGLPTVHGEAGGNGLRFLLLLVGVVALFGVKPTRRAATMTTAKALTALAVPLGVWLLAGGFHQDGLGERATAARGLLTACVGSLALSGPLIAGVGSALYALEARVRPPPLPEARQR